MNGTGNGSFRDKMNEWRGYVLRALEDIDSDLKTLFRLYEKSDKENKAENRKTKEKCEAINQRVNKLYLKVTGVAVVVGSLAGLIFDVAKNALIKIFGG